MCVCVCVSGWVCACVCVELYLCVKSVFYGNNLVWGRWERMHDYILQMKEGSTDKHFFSSVLAVHNNDFHAAKLHIGTARSLLDTKLTALGGELQPCV